MRDLTSLLPWTAEALEQARSDAALREAEAREAARLAELRTLSAAVAETNAPPPEDARPAGRIDQGAQGSAALWLAGTYTANDWLRDTALAFKEAHGASIGVYGSPRR